MVLLLSTLGVAFNTRIFILQLKGRDRNNIFYLNAGIVWSIIAFMMIYIELQKRFCNNENENSNDTDSAEDNNEAIPPNFNETYF